MASKKNKVDCSKNTLKKRLITYIFDKCKTPGKEQSGEANKIVDDLRNKLNNDKLCWFDSIYLFLDEYSRYDKVSQNNISEEFQTIMAQAGRNARTDQTAALNFLCAILSFIEKCEGDGKKKGKDKGYAIKITKTQEDRGWTEDTAGWIIARKSDDNSLVKLFKQADIPVNKFSEKILTTGYRHMKDSLKFDSIVGGWRNNKVTPSSLTELERLEGRDVNYSRETSTLYNIYRSGFIVNNSDNGDHDPLLYLLTKLAGNDGSNTCIYEWLHHVGDITPKNKVEQKVNLEKLQQLINLFEYIGKFKSYGKIFKKLGDNITLVTMNEVHRQKYINTLTSLEQQFIKNASGYKSDGIVLNYGARQLCDVLYSIHGIIINKVILNVAKDKEKAELENLKGQLEGFINAGARQDSTKAAERNKQLQIYKKNWEKFSKYIPTDQKQNAFKDFLKDLPKEYKEKLEKYLDKIPNITESETPGMLVKSSIRF